VQTWRYSSDVRQRGFFLAKRIRGGDDAEGRPKTPVTPLEEFGYTWAIGKLELFEKGFFNGVGKEDQLICFADPSTYDNNPGWPLRNLLVLLRQKWNLNEAQIMCYRDTHMKRDQSNSIILQLKVDAASETAPTTQDANARPRTPKLPKVTGWERTETGKLTSRNVDLSEYMDERKLADQAVDLNFGYIRIENVDGMGREKDHFHRQCDCELFESRATAALRLQGLSARRCKEGRKSC
jgi:ubiquitin-like modifier-activating enzyme ATG7